MRTYRGQCHCGALAFELRTARLPAAWPIRACQCSFCRSHGARTTSDPEASVRFIIPDESRLNRYRFASKSADFYVCHGCGAYVASVIDSPRGRFATLNVNVIFPAVAVPAATPVTYDNETPAQKLARRELKWTPVTDIA
jgi:hypothetical protein